MDTSPGCPMGHFCHFQRWQEAGLGLGDMGGVSCSPQPGRGTGAAPTGAMGLLAAASPALLCAHGAALPGRRRLPLAAVCAEGHFLSSVVAKPSEDRVPHTIAVS